MDVQAGRAARRTANSKTLDRLARLGLLCRAILYALIGVLALQIALGSGGEEADKGGAIKTVAEQPFGTGLLWLMVLGLTALVAWQLWNALVGATKALERFESAARAVVYAIVVVSVLSLLLRGSSGESGDEQSQDFTRSMLELPGGVLLVVAAGAGLVVLGGYWLYQGFTGKFLDELRTTEIPAGLRPVVEKLGLVGYLCRGVIAGVAGVFIVRAALTYDPEQAKGIDATLRSLADTPAGPWLLVAVALGLLLFAGYCLCEARWHRINSADEPAAAR
jgi:Domain of Unknown Function (DUF1206)